MSSANNERFAIAAHLHVLLRRKTGRVTDTEWMASNAVYAAEIVRFCRAKAQEHGHLELAEWADKLEAVTAEAESVLRSNAFRGANGTTPRIQPVVTERQGLSTAVASNADTDPNRYIRGIR
jgi:hypothetical protein